MKKALLLLVALLGTQCITLAQEKPSKTSIQASALITTAIIEIEGMACQEGCADTINKNLENTNGIKTTTVSYADEKAVVSFDSKMISIKDIELIITNTKVKDYVYNIKKTTIQQ